MNDVRTPEDIKQELEGLNSEIIELERQMERTHEESGGNSPEDNSQEAASDFIKRATLGEVIAEKRRRMVELEEELARAGS